MSSWGDCVRDIQAAVGRPLKDTEIESIAQAVQVRMAAEKAKGLSARQAAAKVGKAISTEQQLAAMLQRRNQLNNILKFSDLRAREVVGKEIQTIKGVLSGAASSVARNSATSIDAVHHTLRGDLMAPALAALKKANLLKAVQKGDPTFDRDVARELRRRDDPALEKATGNKQAEAAAKILGQMMDDGRAMQNNAGAFIGHVDGYMGKQYHDMWKIRAAGDKAWIADVAGKLDLDKMYPDLTPAERIGRLQSTWEALKSGVHDSDNSGFLSGYDGPGNLGKKVSQERSLQFKSADDWFDYNAKYGKGSVMDAAFYGADGAARASAIMQQFGTNPEFMFKKWTNSMMERAYARGDDKIGDALKANPYKDLFENVAGKGQIPGNHTGATIGATVRQVSQLIHLGQIAASALTHIPINASIMRYNGGSFLAGIAHQIAFLVPKGPAEKEIAMSLHAGIDGMMGHLIQRFRTEDGVPGMMSKAVDTFHRWNLFGAYMDAQRAGVGTALSQRLAFHAGKEWEALDPRMQQSLTRYGIEKGEWDVGRGAVTKEADGRNYIIPSNIESMGKADPSLETKTVGQKFQTFITGTIAEGMNEPTAWAKSAAVGGTRAGTFFGETARAVMQFKSFMMTMMERQGGRMMRGGKLDIPGSLQLFGGMTIAGYAAMTLRDIVGNRTPRDPTDPANWIEAMTAGGGLGLVGDIFARAGERGAGDMAKSLIGPVPSTVFDGLYGIYHTLHGGGGSESRTSIAAKEGQHFASDLVPNHPFITLPYNYLMGHMFREMVSPGATRRYNNLIKEHGQTPILRPALQ